MIQSMTGFGSGERGLFKVEIRSVNHRFLDLSIKIPQNLNQHEIPLRNMVKERFSRGRFDILVSLMNEENLNIRIDIGRAREIYNALRALKDELALSGTIGIETIAEFKELIITEGGEYNAESLYAAFKVALERLQEMRTREGEAIARDMISRLDRVEQMNGEIALLCPETVKKWREKFEERLKVLFGESNYDEVRLLQEASLMAERTDISEESSRLASHIAQMRKILSDGDTIGRKAEFLLQEFHREANTIASKVDDYRISGIIVEMKAEIEKMREQAQNIQ